MDSTDMEQEQPEAVDSPDSGQEDGGSRDDETGNAKERINGLMRLLGKRTTQAQQQEARATKAEAELAQAREALAAYESGGTMTDDEAAEATEDAEMVEVPDGTQYAEADEVATTPDGGIAANVDFWWPQEMDHDATQQLIDPNSAARASGLWANNLSETDRIRSQFDRGLDEALRRWGVEPEN